MEIFKVRLFKKDRIPSKNNSVFFKVGYLGKFFFPSLPIVNR